jgi:hypothetical protein
MHKRVPLGLDDSASVADGIAPYAGARIPGSFQAVADGGKNLSSVHGAAIAREDPLATPASFPFKVGDDAYRLRRQDVDWRRGLQEVAVDPQKALAILELATQKYRQNTTLMPLLQAAARGLAGLHEGGIFLLFWLRPEQERAAAPAPPPSMPAPKLPKLPEPPPIEEMMPVAQAAVLKNAAAAGVPFCEECARAAARAAGGGAT